MYRTLGLFLAECEYSPYPAHDPACTEPRWLLRCSTVMPTLILHPARIESGGNKPKIIDEYFGRVNTPAEGVSVSIAHMRSPEGWEEPGQTPDFDEYTVVLRGTVRVHSACTVRPANWMWRPGKPSSR